MSTAVVRPKLMQTFGRKKNALACASVREGKGSLNFHFRCCQGQWSTNRISEPSPSKIEGP